MELRRPSAVRAARLALLVLGLPFAAEAGDVGYPLGQGTRWVYHMRQENAPGVHFSPFFATFAHGNVAEMDVEYRVVGRDRIGGGEYARVESTIGGHAYMTEWYRAAADGLYLGKTYDAVEGQEVVMKVPERVLSATLQPGESWTWRQVDDAVTTRFQVHSAFHTTVPAGSFESILVQADLTRGKPPMALHGVLRRYFAPGVGFVKTESETSIAGHRISRVTMTLTRFEARPQAEP